MKLGPAMAVCLALLAADARCLQADYAPRTGFVTLQFDDTHALQYSRVFPALEQHGLKASFGYITETSDLGINRGEAWKMMEIYQAGNEIQDHTTRHDYMWATHVDTLDDGIANYVPYTFASVTTWDSLCQRSLQVLQGLEIQVTGWNQPGGGSGPGSVPGHPQWNWAGLVNDSLYQLIARRYSYALGAGVNASTAHLNLRGHNCPDRYPFFNVPHVTIDSLGIDEIKTGIADAVASGLWYLAVSHAQDTIQVCKVESLIAWLDEKGIEVLTCREGVERVRYGYADPFENQIPQADMQNDLDLNGKPDGFTGDCTWGTHTWPPVDGVKTLRVYGDAEFTCYGPEVGSNKFSIWIKSAASSPCTLSVVYSTYDFDWNCISSVWTQISASTDWTRFDDTNCSNFAMNIDGAADRITFGVKTIRSQPVLVAYPALMAVHSTSGCPQLDGGKQAIGVIVSPNPVRVGTPLEVTSQGPVGKILVYDVLGRCVLAASPQAESHQVTLNTQRLAPGIFFLQDSAMPSRRAKVVVLR
jgi:peptidoglycan/xylan/chitin deacetylase (PgdA/CDA1 family)